MHNLTRRHIENLWRQSWESISAWEPSKTFVHEVGDAVEEEVGALEEQLPQQDKLNIDETGWKKADERRWLWAFVAPTFTFFHIARTRGKEVLEEEVGKSV